ncbi:hypothetical protein [Synechococcus sp. BA-132 BA5]|uniref:hypothetical protein n=1 Tax=Synechococcus sp. BA-132 BA5 TaxID=3110252 RepID=UPI002B1ECCD2|nr:hypothetical protein [Synechococcus sp. BA-132 BA5]MEA5416246.1 hypothetical protein [Synechococcus sp. BA-132 BA5]
MEVIRAPRKLQEIAAEYSVHPIQVSQYGNHRGRRRRARRLEMMLDMSEDGVI